MLSEVHQIQKEKTPIFSFICLSISLILYVCIEYVCAYTCEDYVAVVYRIRNDILRGKERA